MLTGFFSLRRVAVLLLTIAAYPTGLASIAQAAAIETAQGYVTFYGAGWVNAHARVQLTIPFANPDGCSMTDGYITDPSLPGNALFASTLLSAFTSHQKVSVVLDGCLLERPRIIGVYLYS